MTASTAAVRFVHLADIHLTPCLRGGRCGPSDPACHACIKASILDRLRDYLLNHQSRTHLLLLGGDLHEAKECGSSPELSTRPLGRLVREVSNAGIRVVGVTGEHDGEDSTRALREKLGWTWLLRSGDAVREGEVTVQGVEGRPKQVGVAEDLGALRPDGTRPSVLLAHADSTVLSRGGAWRFNYCALGHLHRGMLLQAPKGAASVAGYPGHLFSYWDGCGKAWPAYFIEGAIHGDGTVTAELLSMSSLLGVPEVRRLFVGFEHSRTPGGTLVFENAPDLAFFQTLGIGARVETDVDSVSKKPLRLIARCNYANRQQLREILMVVLRAFPEDVFVAPSAGEAWKNRFADFGLALAGPRFEQCVTMAFKRKAATQ